MIKTATGRQCLSLKQSVCPHQHLLHVRLCECLLPHELLLKLTHPHRVGNSQHPFHLQTLQQQTVYQEEPIQSIYLKETEQGLPCFQ